MTGGAEETERVRKMRDEMALKAMFNVSNTVPPASEPTRQQEPALSPPEPAAV
ncbi:hypothetical protein FIBSPDRAFT_871305 [Athelia psychrophila]|uniref:Uncharacterized protein n=1 Tax=Athelia psychrophila TaxID=1759441 RepID=A0A166ADS5_9AGAM|nr:hypothetical protein FIBSPDRAFT_871305 [Fibularhizoctonia sp. CBS 109695]